MSNPRAALAILLWLALAGCSPTIFALTSYRGYAALDEASLRGLADLADRGDLTKAKILVALGPPVSVIGQDDGEIFIYRRVARDTSTIELNPGYLVPAAPPVPLWSDADVSGRDDLLMVFFGEQGEVRGVSFRQRIWVGLEEGWVDLDVVHDHEVDLVLDPVLPNNAR